MYTKIVQNIQLLFKYDIVFISTDTIVRIRLTKPLFWLALTLLKIIIMIKDNILIEELKGSHFFQLSQILSFLNFLRLSRLSINASPLTEPSAYGSTLGDLVKLVIWIMDVAQHNNFAAMC